jgi:hypothetical protein
MTIKIAIVQASCGHLTCVGPNDFKPGEFNGAMDAAISWHIEAGYMPAATYWAAVEMPVLPEVATLTAILEDEGK